MLLLVEKSFSRLTASSCTSTTEWVSGSNRGPQGQSTAFSFTRNWLLTGYFLFKKHHSVVERQYLNEVKVNKVKHRNILLFYFPRYYKWKIEK